jgi:hypothetical protein
MSKIVDKRGLPMRIHLSTLRTQLGNKRCPYHNEAATINIYGDDIEVGTCCQHFRQQLEPHIENAIDSAGTRVIIDAIKNLFTLPKLPALKKTATR